MLVVLLAGLAAACAGDDDGVEPVASRQCAPLLYEGEGEPDVIVVSDLPRRGIGAETTELMVGAIELVLRKREFRAGELRVGYQSCNDTVGDEPFDASLCRRNAQRVRRQRGRRRDRRPLELRLRGGADSDRQHASGWTARHDQPVEHVRGADATARIRAALS